MTKRESSCGRGFHFDASGNEKSRRSTDLTPAESWNDLHVSLFNFVVTFLTPLERSNFLFGASSSLDLFSTSMWHPFFVGAFLDVVCGDFEQVSKAVFACSYGSGIRLPAQGNTTIPRTPRRSWRRKALDAWKITWIEKRTISK